MFCAFIYQHNRHNLGERDNVIEEDIRSCCQRPGRNISEHCDFSELTLDVAKTATSNNHALLSLLFVG